jgi:chemotaxis protein MotA
MDIATLIGLTLAFGALLVSVFIEGGGLAGFVNVPAIIIVIGGTLGATVLSYPMKQIIGLPAVMKHAFMFKELDAVQVMRQIVEYARKARREGILALEQEARNTDSQFLRLGIQLVVDGTPAELVREILETEVHSMRKRHSVGESIFSTMGGFAPTLGILGTVMGLVNMLARLSEPGEMGHAIAAAFCATLYGVGIANLVFLPIGNKLKLRSHHEAALYELIIEGVLALQEGDNPRVVQSKMEAFLPAKEKAQLAQQGAE